MHHHQWLHGCELQCLCVAPVAAGEAGFLPDLAFPFVKLFGPKAESVFEAVATLLLNWCQGWFELFPNPPLPLLRRFLVGVLDACDLHSRSSTHQHTRFKEVAANSPADSCLLTLLSGVVLQLMLSQHDLQLGSHLEQLGVPLLERLWRIMSCGMSELLPAADDWLVLWDNCLAAASGPAFYYAALAAYLITQRVNLLAVTNKQQLDRVLAARPAVDVRKVCSGTGCMLRNDAFCAVHLLLMLGCASFGLGTPSLQSSLSSHVCCACCMPAGRQAGTPAAGAHTRVRAGGRHQPAPHAAW